MGMGYEDELRDLNKRTFELEAKPEGWEDELRRILADNFEIRRADPKLPAQNLGQAIEFIRAQQPMERTVLEDTVWHDGGLGVVVSVVTLSTQPDAAFQNIKVFVHDGNWRCLYWQVTRIDRKDKSSS
jgi:hypothetical protein